MGTTLGLWPVPSVLLPILWESPNSEPGGLTLASTKALSLPKCRESLSKVHEAL